MIEQFEVTVPAVGGPQRRGAAVYVPERSGRFPVLYLFDGQTAFSDKRAPFGESLRMGELLDSMHASLIVAAVDCDPENRLTEYSPFAFSSQYGSSAGRGEVYLDWLVRTFKEKVDEKFPTLPQRSSTYLAGCSMGGLMTMYALCRYPEIFAGGAALSPSLWVAPAACAKMIADADWQSGAPALYFDYGEKELGGGTARKEALAGCCEALVKKGVPFTFRIIGGGTHSETSWRNRLPTVLKMLNLV